MGDTSAGGRGYWASQMIVCLLFGIGGVVYGSIVLATDFEPEKGRGLIGFLIGVMFLWTFRWLVKAYRKGGPTGRAVYAWAITQHEYVPVRRVDGDLHKMAIAARARDGLLTIDELRALQALRPDRPYPGEWPTG
ncbi:hypothetical protein [Aeromicrobium stalagmiti]|uniref:hypothetical protein n=1 Tax=Aeromicrobium stalagmiti TaxID=2738988 RepID=UPI0015698200|nr:hypothetical protein [Aeromicrobium stalagmiti]NRQ50341.1 hypothetical protein [Aeromicrobium stalagmiti]